MKRTIRLLIAAVAALAVAAPPATSYAGGNGDPGDGPGRRHKALSARAAVAAMQPGWNLGNTFDAVGADETAWGNPRVTEELLAALRAQGFRSIRIPVTWHQHIGPGPDYRIDPERLERVKQVVDWALDDGFFVMINMHHDSWQWVMDLPTRHDEVLARYRAVWTQVAAAFRDSSPRLVLESINEPFFTGSSGGAQNHELMRELNVTFHEIVRSSGGRNATRLLVLPTLHTSGDQAPVDELAATIAALDDPYLIATIHFYGYWPFSVNVAGGTRFDETVRDDLTTIFDRAHDAFVARGVPVIIGEYGLLGFDVHTGTVQQGEKLKFFEFLGHYARTRRITTMLWDNGQHFGRTSLQWSDPDLFAQIRSSWRTRSGTASSDLLFVRRTEPVAARTVALNLNGNRLTGVFDGSRRLVRGRDYAVGGDQLTLSAELLTRLVGDRGYGVNSVLSLRFNRGVPWKLHVISFDRPVLSAAAGTTDSLAIPVDFRGDQLATMEARYADGSNAGPHGWTSFKEFGRAFSPDYAAGRITLPHAFFNEMNDDSEVTLTFHFWSGETVRYTLTRSGTTVAGTPAS